MIVKIPNVLNIGSFRIKIPEEVFSDGLVVCVEFTTKLTSPRGQAPPCTDMHRQ